jgi:hypothetical protein
MLEDMDDMTKTADDMYKMSLTKAQTVGKGKRLIFLECGSGSSIFLVSLRENTKNTS